MKCFLACLFVISMLQSTSAGNLFSEKDTTVLLNRLRVKTALRENLQSEVAPGGETARKRKSIARSVVFSAILPGSGQLYAKSYFKAAIFFAAEVAAWAINLRYNQLGDSKSAEFRRFADMYWSEYRYWSYVYYRLIMGNPPPGLPVFPTFEQNGWVLLDPSVYEEARRILKQYEDSRYIPGFTHRLPDSKTQQYYEMIGKYPEQFGNAWEDANFNDTYSGFRNHVTPLNARYADLRSESNRLYDIAGYGAMVALINHLISAIDAGFTTRGFNRRQIKMSYKNVRYNGEYVNMFGLKLTW